MIWSLNSIQHTKAKDVLNGSYSLTSSLVTKGFWKFFQLFFFLLHLTESTFLQQQTHGVKTDFNPDFPEDVMQLCILNFNKASLSVDQFLLASFSSSSSRWISCCWVWVTSTPACADTSKLRKRKKNSSRCTTAVRFMSRILQLSLNLLSTVSQNVFIGEFSCLPPSGNCTVFACQTSQDRLAFLRSVFSMSRFLCFSKISLYVFTFPTSHLQTSQWS